MTIRDQIYPNVGICITRMPNDEPLIEFWTNVRKKGEDGVIYLCKVYMSHCAPWSTELTTKEMLRVQTQFHAEVYNVIMLLKPSDSIKRYDGNSIFNADLDQLDEIARLRKLNGTK